MILKARRADWEEYKKPAWFSFSMLLPVKQCVYSIPRQDATWRQPEGIAERWRVHSSVEEMGFRDWEEEADFFFPFTLRRMAFSSLISEKKNRENTGELRGSELKRCWMGDNRGEKKAKNKKRQEGSSTRKALLSELQHGRKWHVECRKRKPDRYRFIWWLPLKNMSIPLEASVTCNVLIKANFIGLLPTLLRCCHCLPLIWTKKTFDLIMSHLVLSYLCSGSTFTGF